MKKLLLLFSLLTFCAFQAQGWGRLGHATIAEIAQRHLTPAARANIEKYTHGTPLAEYASWMDEVGLQESAVYQAFETRLQGYRLRP